MCPMQYRKTSLRDRVRPSLVRSPTEQPHGSHCGLLTFQNIQPSALRPCHHTKVLYWSTAASHISAARVLRKQPLDLDTSKPTRNILLPSRKSSADKRYPDSSRSCQRFQTTAISRTGTRQSRWKVGVLIGHLNTAKVHMQRTRCKRRTTRIYEPRFPAYALVY